MEPTWFDTHAHLCDPRFDEDRDSAVERAFKAGVGRIVEIADGPDEWDKARRLSEKYPGRIWWAAGFHPYYAALAQSESWRILKDLGSHPQFVAIGEVGLDYAKSTIDPEVQKQTFRKAVEFAQEFNKPLIIHCRNAFSDLLSLLRDCYNSKNTTGASPGVVHCFSGNSEEASELLKMGFYLGVDAPVMYPNSKALRDTLMALPLEKLVLETDSPYLPPQTHRGKRNEPSYLPQIGRFLADLKNIESINFSRQLTQNGLTLFRINSDR